MASATQINGSTALHCHHVRPLLAAIDMQRSHLELYFLRARVRTSNELFLFERVLDSSPHAVHFDLVSIEFSENVHQWRARRCCTNNARRLKYTTAESTR